MHSGRLFVSNAVPTPERYVQHVDEGAAPDALCGPLEERKSLARAFHDRGDQPALRAELLDQRRRDLGAGCRYADRVEGRMLGIAQSSVAVDEDPVGVARPC